MLDPEQGGDINTHDNFRADWIEIRKSLGRHIAYFEAGNKIHPRAQGPDKVMEEFLARMRQCRFEAKSWLAHFQSKAE